MTLAKNIMAMLLVTGSLWGCALNTQSSSGAAVSLAGSQWQVLEIDGEPVIADSEVTLAFTEQGRVFGSSSCNRFNGGWHMQGEKLSFTHMAATKMACLDALMQQENRFLSLLGDVDRYQVENDGRLVLTTGQGTTLRALPSDR
ncbi:META domain-containing protein [Marinobacter sp. VGCF2001]|uniref:META domain-containing protein n=1 Tax=Marinobacter sp. VGCF2001 TaxID=3417189 RepID=UPI003CF92A0B